MLFSSSFSARSIATIDATTLPWRSDGVLILVQGGRGTLRWAADWAHPGGARRVLVLGDTTLVHAQADEYWCPTCEKLLAMGAGREHVSASALDSLRVSSETDAPVCSILERLSPLLRLLRDGVYLVSRVRHFPTNGEGLPFWALGGALQRLRASRDWYFTDLGLFRSAPGYPAFLLPTQPLDRCDWARVEEYRRRIRAGSSIGGLAYWAEGFLSVLLDGHHRATAALLEGVPLECLTVMDVGVTEVKEGHRSLLLWDERIPFTRLPDAAVRLLEQHLREDTSADARSAGPVSDVPGADWVAHPRWPQLRDGAARFPDVLGIAALEIVGDSSDARIEVEDDASQLWLLLQALIASKDPRAVRLALRIGRGPWFEPRETAFQFLSTKRDPEIEDFFIDFLVRDEGQYPELKHIADAYLAGSNP